MSKYFKNVETLEELRRKYKELLKQFHPDNPNGSTEATQAINTEYDKLFKVLKDRHESKATADSTDNKTDNKTSFEQMKWDTAADEKLREVLQQVISLNGIEIELVGCYIWIDGTTYPHRETLKTIGCRWSRNRKKWYWTSSEYIGRGNNKMSFADIQNKYGSTKIKSDTRVLLEA